MNRFHKNKQYYGKHSWVIQKVHREIDAGLQLLNAVDNRIVSFFGSHRIRSTSPYYLHCKQVAFKLGKRDYAILTGGGTGVMRAANEGATKAKAISIGLRAELLKGEVVRAPIYTYRKSFHFLFVRRFLMSIRSDALIFYPGGFGTLNELFEFAMLMQTGIVDRMPIICVNRKYWSGLLKWMRNNLLPRHFFVHDVADLRLLHLVDTADEVFRLL